MPRLDRVVTAPISPPGPAKPLTQGLQIKDDFCVNLGAPHVRRHPDGSGTGCRGRTGMLRARPLNFFFVLMLNQ
jgi:hypothetical protein